MLPQPGLNAAKSITHVTIAMRTLQATRQQCGSKMSLV